MDIEYILATKGPSCTGCKSSSPAVANCFSCSALLCANCVIAHQLMVAFEVSVLFDKYLESFRVILLYFRATT